MNNNSKHVLSIVSTFISMLLLLGVASTVKAQNIKYIELEPSGEYKNVDVGKQNDVINKLLGDDRSIKEELIKQIQSRPEEYNPAVLHMVAHVLVVEGNYKDGSFWFLASQFRARYDAYRCTDATSQSGVQSLFDKLGPPVIDYYYNKAGMDQFEEAIEKVIQWDKKVPYNYDHRWICLHGIKASLAGMGHLNDEIKSVDKPKEEWPVLYEEVQKRFRELPEVILNSINENKKVNR